MDFSNREPKVLKLALSVILSTLGLLLALMSNPGSAMAQNSQYEQLQEYIDRNAELLEGAFDLVHTTKNRPARRTLEIAANLHHRSVHQFDDNRLIVAKNTAKSSRTAIRLAAQMARESMGFEERVRLQAEHLRDQLAYLLEQARERNNQRAIVFLLNSEDIALSAREQYQQGDARLAFKMLQRAEELLNPAYRMLAQNRGPDHLDHKLEIAWLAVEHARDKLQECSDPAALKLLTESKETLELAWVLLEQGQAGRALQLTDLAQRQANLAVSVGSGGPSPETVRRQIERWDKRADQVADQVRQSGDEDAGRLLERAREHRKRARESLDKGETELALRQIRTAHDLLTQTEDRI